MYDLTVLQKIVMSIIPILFAITLHEVAHGWVANLLGDATARLMGRLTINPIKHIDMLGTIIVPAIALFLGGFIIGWAKPVPVDYRNLHHPKRDMALVAAAGPGANLIMAIIWGFIIKLGVYLKLQGMMSGILVIYMGQVGVSINIILMVLNLFPLPPLDGSRVVTSFLPARAGYYYNRLEPYGFLILMPLLFLGILGAMMSPIVNWLQGTLYAFLGF